MEENKINFFAIPVFSFVPPKYSKLIKESGGKIFGALLIGFLILSVITGIRVGKGMDEVNDTIRESCPEFTLIDGEFEIEQPFSFNEDNMFVKIDDSIEKVSEADIKEIWNSGSYQQIIVLGRYGFGMMNNGQVQAFEYKDLGDFTISKDKLCDEFVPAIKSVVVIVVIACAIILIGLYYFVALIVQLFTMPRYSTKSLTALRDTDLPCWPSSPYMYSYSYSGCAM